MKQPTFSWLFLWGFSYCRYYRELFKYHIDVVEVHLIREAAHYCQPIGDDRLKEEIEMKYGIKLGQSKRGRPNKVVEELVKK